MKVTKRLDATEAEWKTWTWISQGDEFVNGAFFTPSGATQIVDERKNFFIPARPGAEVATLTRYAGPRKCERGHPC